MNQSRRAGRTPPGRGAAPGRRVTGHTASPRGGLLFHVPSFSIGLVLGAVIVLTTGYLPELLAPPPEPAKPGDTTASSGQTRPELRFEFDKILRTPPAPVAADTPEAGQANGPLPDGALAVAPPGSPPDGAANTPAATLSGTATGTPSSGEIESATPGVLDDMGPTVTTSTPLAANPPAAPTPGTPGADLETAAAEVPTAASAEPAVPEPAASYMLQAASFRSRTDAERLRAELLLLDLPATTGEVNVGNAVWYRVTVGPFVDQRSADVARERLQERNLTAIPFRR